MKKKTGKPMAKGKASSDKAKKDAEMMALMMAMQGQGQDPNAMVADPAMGVDVTQPGTVYMPPNGMTPTGKPPMKKAVARKR